MLGSALLISPWLSSFRNTHRETASFGAASSKWGYSFIAPMALIYVITNLAVIVLSWFPVDVQQTLGTAVPVLPYFTGPIAALCLLAFGALYWCWDLHVLPFLGYTIKIVPDEVDDETWNVRTLRINFYVSNELPALAIPIRYPRQLLT